MNFKCLFGHQWNGCKCERCGKTRDEGHNYLAVDGKCIEKCSICNKERGIEHKWNGCKCERCGKTRNEQHSLKNGKCCKCEKTIEKLASECLKKSEWSQSGNPQCRYYSKKADFLVIK